MATKEKKFQLFPKYLKSISLVNWLNKSGGLLNNTFINTQVLEPTYLYSNSLGLTSYLLNKLPNHYFSFFQRLATTTDIFLASQMFKTQSFGNVSNQFHKWLHIFSPYSRSLIIRGIGYRLYPVISTDISGDIQHYSYNRYIYLRSGHSFPTYCGVPNSLGLKSSKKERKLVIYGYNNDLVGCFSDRLFYYRPPNAFTGRGIRFKRTKYKRKPGKRAQKGRSF